MMQKNYITQEGDMLDQIAYRAYGTEAAVSYILQANYKLSFLKERLPAGLNVILPLLSKPIGKQKMIRLWGLISLRFI